MFTSSLLVLVFGLIPHVQGQCSNVSQWKDSDGLDCTWYDGIVGNDDEYYYDDDQGRDRCEVFGNCCFNQGHTAVTACCICGGGTDYDKCTDVQLNGVTWVDSAGDGCEVYDPALNQVGNDDYYYDDGDTFCSYFGDMYQNEGFTANQACCICGGGRKNDEGIGSTPAPTIDLTASPSTFAVNDPSVTEAPTSSNGTPAPTMDTTPSPIIDTTPSPTVGFATADPTVQSSVPPDPITSAPTQQGQTAAPTILMNKTSMPTRTARTEAPSRFPETESPTYSPTRPVNDPKPPPSSPSLPTGSSSSSTSSSSSKKTSSSSSKSSSKSSKSKSGKSSKSKSGKSSKSSKKSSSNTMHTKGSQRDWERKLDTIDRKQVNLTHSRAIY